jgi:tripartite-type tricarboxylate transporter receptor subunit TctC
MPPEIWIRHPLKQVLSIFGAAVWLVAAAAQAGAQNWPQQPIHVIVSFGAGGGADIVARIVAEAMQNRLGQPVIVENKPGAGGIWAISWSPARRPTATRSE